jgi:hypothetical protein
MQQHVLDDGISALAVLHDLVEIALQRFRNLADLRSQLAIEVGTSKRLPQFINKLDRDAREIIDEIERVLDLVRDTGGELDRVRRASASAPADPELSVNSLARQSVRVYEPRHC